jgi:hypothetical protein
MFKDGEDRAGGFVGRKYHPTHTQHQIMLVYFKLYHQGLNLRRRVVVSAGLFGNV